MKNYNILNGWLNIDKPAGVTSNFIVQKLKKLYRPKKIGHAGTLDPFATGVLPIAMGEATKTVQFMMDQDKEYEFTIKFGAKTDSYDVTGNITEQNEAKPDLEKLKNIIPNFIGEIEQTPPIYSAIKINGQRAYDMARKGENFTINKRKIMIYNLELTDFSSENDTATLKVSCSKGTYIRSLAVDIAEKIGCLGFVLTLRRTKVGSFHVNEASESNILPTEIVLSDISAYSIDEKQQQDVIHGKQLELGLIDQELVQLVCDGKLVAVGKLIEGYFKSVRVFNL